MLFSAMCTTGWSAVLKVTADIGANSVTVTMPSAINISKLHFPLTGMLMGNTELVGAEAVKMLGMTEDSTNANTNTYVVNLGTATKKAHPINEVCVASLPLWS